MHRIGRPHLYIGIIAAAVLEGSFLNLFSIGSMQPNLMLIFVIFIGLHSDWQESLEAGIAGGILRGIMGTGSIAGSLIIFGLLGIFANYLKGKVYKDNFIAQVIVIFLIGILFNGLALFTKLAAGYADIAGLSLWQANIKFLVVVSFYTSLFSPPAFFLLTKSLKIKKTRF